MGVAKNPRRRWKQHACAQPARMRADAARTALRLHFTLKVLGTACNKRSAHVLERMCIAAWRLQGLDGYKLGCLGRPEPTKPCPTSATAA